MTTITKGKKINSRQDFLADCNTFCDEFRTQLGDEKLMITYVRRGKQPSQNIFIKDADGTVTVARQGRKRPQGVIVSYKQDGRIMIGWSLCRKTEPFNKIIGLRYAIERAIPLDELKELPICISTCSKTLDAASEAEKEDIQKELDTLTAKLPPQSVQKTLNRFIERIERIEKK